MMNFPAVIKLHATYQDPDYNCPWQSNSPETSKGSGVVLEGGGILTAAHVVANATFLQVQKSSGSQREVAHVEAVCHDSDLALVRCANPDFLSDVEPLPLGDVPSLRDKVLVCGFPIGGSELSITEGVVSRVEVQTYTHSQRGLLAVTVDAAINSGNSGGPVLRDNKVIGIAFQSMEDAENIGEVIPIPLIKQFLRAVDAGRPTCVPELGVLAQKLENPTLRRHLQMDTEEQGVLVCEVGFGSSAWGVIKRGDVLLSVDHTPIDNDGTVMLFGRYRTSFVSLCHRFVVGESVSVRVLRDGQRLDLSVTLQGYRALVPRDKYDQLPSYFVYAGLVFQPLSRNFLQGWSDWYDNAPKELLFHYYFGFPKPEKTEVVVLSHVLADEVNVGYSNLDNSLVHTVNGMPVRDLKDLIAKIEAAGQSVVIETTQHDLIVFDKVKAEEAQARILERYHVHRDRSVELVEPAEPTPST